jgi:MFS family permease
MTGSEDATSAEHVRLPAPIARPLTALNLPRTAAADAVGKLDDSLGGPARRHVVVVLALVLGLDSADQATVGASATQLRDAFTLTNTDIGLLIAVTGLTGAAATLPFGVLVDRIDRTRLLAAATVLWAAAMAVCAAAPSFEFLLVARLGLGAVTAVAVPAVASLIGDWFGPGERARIYGFVLSGELIGAGVGFSVAGGLAALSWRASFLVLTLPALGVGWLTGRLPEPARGGSSRLREGVESLEEGPAAPRPAQPAETGAGSRATADGDPAAWPLWRALRYVVTIRTNVFLVVAGACGYFFFAGIRAFGVEFVKAQYGVGQPIASAMTLILGAAAVVGVLLAGTLSDRLTGHGRTDARLLVGAAALVTAAVLFVPALLTSSIAIATLALSGAAFALAGTNPPLDAARLDIMPAALWGRAEAVRTLLREPAQALAPLLFGVVADHAFGGGHAGLRNAFLLMLLPLLVGAAVLARARSGYRRDVSRTNPTVI